MRINLGWVAVAGVALVAMAGYAGYRIGMPEEPSSPEIEVAVVEEKIKPVAPISGPPEEDPSIAEIDAMLEEAFEEPAAPEPRFNDEEMRARQERWQNMTIEQQRMLRKSMFAALAKVDGLEEVGDAIRKGKLDPRAFRLDPEGIAFGPEASGDAIRGWSFHSRPSTCSRIRTGGTRRPSWA